MREWIPELIGALDEEIRHVQNAGRPRSLFVHSGDSIRPGSTAVAGVSAIRYRTSEDFEIPGDTIGKLHLESSTHDASVLESEPGVLVLAVEHPSGPLNGFSSGTFERDSTDLLRRLRDVLGAADEHDFNWDLLAKVRGSREPAVARSKLTLAGLSPDQEEAARFAIGSEVLFIQGPPGTGKTHTIGRIVQGVLASGRSILVTSHTHVAVDQALLASAAASKKDRDHRLVRLGTPRLPNVPSEYVQHSAKDAFTRFGRATAYFCTLAKRYADPVVLAHDFDVVLIDEVSMANAALALPALAGARKAAILVGDPHQLPPIVQSNEPAARRWLGRDLFALCNARSRSCFAMLTLQRRMRPPIADIARSLEYSAGELIDHPSTERPAPHLVGTVLGDVSLGAIETSIPAGTVQWFENSAWNLHSALSTVALAHQILEKADFPHTERRPIGIITFYTKQRMLLTRLCAAAGILDHVLPGTVHTFQGNEVQVALLDPVLTAADRNNRLRKAEDLDDTSRQMNVAVSRARDQLAAVGDVSKLRFLPQSSGLGKLMASFTNVPITRWDLDSDQNLWPVERDPSVLFEDVDEAGAAVLIGSKQTASRLESVLLTAHRSGLPVAVLCTDDKPRPMSLPSEVGWVRWHDPAPDMLFTERELAVAGKSGAWIRIDDESTHKVVTDFMRITELISILGEGESFRCRKCDSDLVGQVHRFGKLYGETVLACPRYGKGGCKGSIIVLRRQANRATGRDHRSAVDPAERDYLERVGRQRSARAIAKADSGERIAELKRTGVEKCRHAADPDTCPYCKWS